MSDVRDNAVCDQLFKEIFQRFNCKLNNLKYTKQRYCSYFCSCMRIIFNSQIPVSTFSSGYEYALHFFLSHEHGILVLYPCLTPIQKKVLLLQVKETMQIQKHFFIFFLNWEEVIHASQFIDFLGKLINCVIKYVKLFTLLIQIY